ncbi:MAG: glycoside hydrolase family 3 C-terminal domain-containing protein, partial [Bacteroidales bacterium]|nr:glycoside hydrolase family 3 C-terminal domain-containing protein [Bacteroidales bacterium]
MAGAMVGHLYMPAIEPVKGLSSSISKNVVTGLLKEEMGFDGIIFSDAMEMKGAYQGIHPDSVGFKAIMAGIDVVLMPVNPEKTIKNIVNQLDRKDAEKRVEESCKKVLRYKYRLGIADYQPQQEQFVDNDLHQAKYYNLRQRLYNEAVTMLKNERETLPLDKSQKIAVLTFGKKDAVAKKLKNEGCDVKCYVVEKELDKAHKTKILNDLKKFDLVIVNIQNTTISATKGFGISDATVDFVKEISKNNRIVFNLFACPYALNQFTFKKAPAAVLVAYEDVPDAVNAVVDVMVGRLNPLGRLPVTVNKKFKAGDGLSFNGFLSPETLPVALIDNEYTHKIDSVANNGIEIGAYPGCQIFA